MTLAAAIALTIITATIQTAIIIGVARIAYRQRGQI